MQIFAGTVNTFRCEKRWQDLLASVRAYKVGSFRVSNNLAWKRDLYETVNLITQFREGTRPADGARPNNLNKQIINIRSRETTSA